MAGLLKPKAARILIGAIRERHPDLVNSYLKFQTMVSVTKSRLFTFTHMILLELALLLTKLQPKQGMSGLTSQPSMGAVCTILDSEPKTNTGIDFSHIQSLNTYWEQVRLMYSCFDSGLKSGDSSVYLHEMPGGQYTNLLFQAQSLGLGEQWEEIKKAYATANRLAGDIVKVTPSSKVVGDLAQFIVSQKLTEQQVIDGASTLSFPQSFLEYLQGQLGIPPYGFLEPFRTQVLEAKRLEPIAGRPGASLKPIDFQELKGDLEDEFGLGQIRDVDLLSSALYPKVFGDYMRYVEQYGNLQNLPTAQFLTPLKVGEEFTFESTPGRIMIIQLVAIGPLNEESGKRDVYFTLNGEVRQLSITDEQAFKTAISASSKATRLRADPGNKGDVGAPMSGLVVEVRVKVGDEVKVGDPIVVMSAMKMETIVSAPVSGKVAEIFVKENENVNSGELV
ncbi:pyruvate carboxylase, partial [Nowakowskiella sp. JEL0078]